YRKTKKSGCAARRCLQYLASLLELAPFVRDRVELWLWTGAWRPDQLIVHPETHLIAVQTVGNRNVLNITVSELATHFKEWVATGHLLGPLQLPVMLGLFDVANCQSLNCLRRR